jgi:hypothetical protein
MTGSPIVVAINIIVIIGCSSSISNQPLYNCITLHVHHLDALPSTVIRDAT